MDQLQMPKSGMFVCCFDWPRTMYLCQKLSCIGYNSFMDEGIKVVPMASGLYLHVLTLVRKSWPKSWPQSWDILHLVIFQEAENSENLLFLLEGVEWYSSTPGQKVSFYLKIYGPEKFFEKFHIRGPPSSKNRKSWFFVMVVVTNVTGTPLDQLPLTSRPI